jgi:T4 RnlA family RNA ligase
MEVLDYLNSSESQDPIAELKDKFGIKSSYNEEYGLYVLNYSQIDSPKFHPITAECRSLVILWCDVFEEYQVVSRAFDRFFNYGEGESTEGDSGRMLACEKLDGSLVTLFHYNDEWLYRTKSMIMPTLEINGFTATWDEVIEESFDWDNMPTNMLNKAHSYIFEVTSPENRVIVRYKKRTATLLTIRNNETGEYLDRGYADIFALQLAVSRPKMYVFNTFEDVFKAVKELPNLEEGYVMYLNDAPYKKLKNPAYVAAHHLRGEGLNPKRLMDLLIMNEVDEYLSVFPEDKAIFEPYTIAFNNMFASANFIYEINRNIESQKDFALKVKDTPVSGLMFAMRKGAELNDAFEALPSNSKYGLINNYMSANPPCDFDAI